MALCAHAHQCPPQFLGHACKWQQFMQKNKERATGCAELHPWAAEWLGCGCYAQLRQQVWGVPVFEANPYSWVISAPMSQSAKLSCQLDIHP